VTHDAPFAWEEIASPTTQFNDYGAYWDQISAPISLPFTFPYMGRSHASIRVSGDGFILLGDGGATGPSFIDPPNPQALPAGDTRGDIIAALWTPLANFGGYPDSRVFIDASATRIIFEWQGAETSTDFGRAVTMQLVLFPNGRFEHRILSGGIPAAQRAVVGFGSVGSADGATLAATAGGDLSRRRWVSWPSSIVPKMAYNFVLSAVGKANVSLLHLCDAAAASRPLDTLYLPCTSMANGAPSLNTGGFSVYTFEAVSPGSNQLTSASMTNISTFISNGGVALFASNKSTTSTAPVLTTAFANSFGIATFGAAFGTPPSMVASALGQATTFSGGVPTLVPTADVAGTNGYTVASVAGGPLGGAIVRTPGAVVRANQGRTLWMSSLLDDHRTDSTYSGTRFVDADGDGIGDLVELYRNHILNGLYTVDTDNNGIDDRDPVAGP
jgi:hypothetical protein